MTAQPHSLALNALGPARKKYQPGQLEARHGRFDKGTVLPETRVPSCPRRRVADFPEGFLKQKWIEQLEQNQLLPHCCRHPERHEIEAFKSHPAEDLTDIYIFICESGHRHIKFCVGMGDPRPEWK